MTEKCPVCNNELAPDDAACPHCGFKLLGSTQRFAPVALPDEVLARGASPPPRPPCASCAGRRPACPSSWATRLDHRPQPPARCVPERHDRVAREHALVEPCEGGYAIRDTNSFNGVWVNNDSVDAPRSPCRTAT